MIRANRELSDADRRLNVEGRLLAIVSNYGGQRIIASPAMDRMIADLADEVDALAREGFLRAVTELPEETS